ncbi:hypothetical protein XENOCAPTIV_021580 [Xenoophorus captivus]|uniref:Uncharacterized protein n=1 Tax=Xenoophorus captivus TaxID=1517983 RepID=A0ABV0S230_9TELE
MRSSSGSISHLIDVRPDSRWFRSPLPWPETGSAPVLLRRLSCQDRNPDRQWIPASGARIQQEERIQSAPPHFQPTRHGNKDVLLVDEVKEECCYIMVQLVVKPENVTVIVIRYGIV